MIRVIFKNLEKSDLVKAIVLGRLDPLVKKFPDLEGCLLHVTLEMQKSPLRTTGPEHFTVKVCVGSGRYKGLTLAKSGPRLYLALADVTEHLLEALNRFGDRHRVYSRMQQRKFAAERTDLALVSD